MGITDFIRKKTTEYRKEKDYRMRVATANREIKLQKLQQKRKVSDAKTSQVTAIAKEKKTLRDNQRLSREARSQGFRDRTRSTVNMIRSTGKSLSGIQKKIATKSKHKNNPWAVQTSNIFGNQNVFGNQPKKKKKTRKIKTIIRYEDY